MSQNPSSRQSLGPLSVGNIVSASLRLYRDHFKPYFLVSLRVTLWAFFPFVAILPLVVIAALTDNNIPLILLLIPVWLAILVYSLAKALTNGAVISRLAFGTLTNQPETVTDARKKVAPLMWRFLSMQVLLGLVLFLVNLLLTMAQLASFGTLGFLLGNLVGRDSVIILLVSLLGNIIFSTIYFWIYARYFIPEVPLAVENNISSFDALSRSLSLTKGFATKILVTILVALVITIPVYIIAGIPLVAGFVRLFMDNVTVGGVPSSDMAIQLTGTIVLSIVLFFLINIAALPFWQAMKAVIYYDLRSRREGLDLELRDSLGK